MATINENPTTGTGTVPTTGSQASASEAGGGLQGSLQVSVKKSDIMNRVYAQSAWHCAIRPQVPRLTADQEPMLLLTMHKGYVEMCGRLRAWLVAHSLSPKAEDGCVQLWLRIGSADDSTLSSEVAAVVAELLSSYVLKVHYATTDSYFTTAWRKSMAQLLLIMAREELRQSVLYGARGRYR